MPDWMFPGKLSLVSTTAGRESKVSVSKARIFPKLSLSGPFIAPAVLTVSCVFYLLLLFDLILYFLKFDSLII